MSIQFPQTPQSSVVELRVIGYKLVVTNIKEFAINPIYYNIMA